MPSFPPFVVVDTSAAIEVLIREAEFHAEYVALFKRLREDGLGICCSELLGPELVEAAYAWDVRRMLPGRWRSERRDGMLVRPRARELTIADEWLRFVGEDAYLTVPIADVFDASVAIVNGTGLRSYDAVHLATAACLDLPIVTHDRGMIAWAGDVTVYTERGMR